MGEQYGQKHIKTLKLLNLYQESRILNGQLLF